MLTKNMTKQIITLYDHEMDEAIDVVVDDEPNLPEQDERILKEMTPKWTEESLNDYYKQQ